MTSLSCSVTRSHTSEYGRETRLECINQSEAKRSFEQSCDWQHLYCYFLIAIIITLHGFFNEGAWVQSLIVGIVAIVIGTAITFEFYFNNDGSEKDIKGRMKSAFLRLKGLAESNPECADTVETF